MQFRENSRIRVVGSILLWVCFIGIPTYIMTQRNPVMQLSNRNILRQSTKRFGPGPITMRKNVGCGALYAPIFTANDRFSVSASSDDTISVWDLNTCERFAIFPSHQPLTAIATCANVSMLASGDTNGNITIWRQNDNGYIADTNWKGHAEGIVAIFFSPRNRGN